MASGTFITKAYTDFTSNYNGTGRDDTGSVYYWKHEQIVNFFNEANASLALDQASITPVTGFNPGTYEGVWLFPKTLTANEFAQTDCGMGPIEATVVVGSSGEVTSITPTLKNGCYITGETLRLIPTTPNLASPMGTSSSPVEVTVSVGSSIDMNYAGSRFFAREGISWTTPYAVFYFASNRRNVYQDTLYMRRVGKNITSNVTTTTYVDHYYVPQGWDTNEGRAEYSGTDNTESMSSTTATSGSGFYHFYYNTTPGSEVLVWGDTTYEQLIGFYHADTSEGFIGETVFSDWVSVIGTSTFPFGYLSVMTDPVYGHDNLTMNAGISRAGFFKPWRVVESDNFVIAGGNENLLHCSNSTPMYSVYTTGDGLVSFRTICGYCVARV